MRVQPSELKLEMAKNRPNPTLLRKKSVAAAKFWVQPAELKFLKKIASEISRLNSNVNKISNSAGWTFF